MAEILHRIGATASPDTVYAALTTIDGLAGWWTAKTTDAGDDVIRFRFDVPHGEDGFDMLVLETVPAELVRWEVVDGPAEWVGTQIRFDLKQEDDFTIVLFRHEGWREPVEFMYHCSTKWATFLMSLKEFTETGSGRPAPDDVQISNWH